MEEFNCKIIKNDEQTQFLLQVISYFNNYFVYIYFVAQLLRD